MHVALTSDNSLLGLFATTFKTELKSMLNKYAGLATTACILKWVVMIAVVLQRRPGRVMPLLTAEPNLRVINHHKSLAFCKPARQAITSNFSLTWDAL